MSHNVLDILGRHHQEWIELINSFGKCDNAEDLVQDAYIKIDKYCTEDKAIKDGEPNRAYLWFVFRSVYYQSHQKTPEIKLGEGFQVEYEEEVNDFERAFDEILYKINKEKTSWHWYDVKLFDLYTKSDMSMRDISSETGISLSSIFQTLKNCKTKLKKAIGEDYQDFINGDYDKI